MTRPLDSQRPNLAGLDPVEVARRKRLMAEQPLPRDGCPGCLRDLRPWPTQARRGWCRHCVSRKEAILFELLRVADPHWRLPTPIAVLESTVQLARERIEADADAVERARRALAKLEADLRYLRAEYHVCLRCTRAPAGRTQLCRACQDAWEKETG